MLRNEPHAFPCRRPAACVLLLPALLSTNLLSGLLCYLQSKVTGHDGKPPRSEVGHVQETLTGSGKQQKPSPATMHMAFTEPVRSRSGGAEQLTASSAAERLPQVGLSFIASHTKYCWSIAMQWNRDMWSPRFLGQGTGTATMKESMLTEQ